jgi:methylated-DNA-[protein]-cysteine S-methyltransferase
MMKYQYSLTIDSPLGLILVQGSKTHIQYLKFDDGIDGEHGDSQNLLSQTAADWANTCREQVKQYFSGQLASFNLPIDPQGTEFQKRVWLHLCDVKNGELSSYQDLALAAGNIKAVRAVASANARNPICLLIPCHRIIGRDRALRGYAGGIERKGKLLQLEKHTLACTSAAAINEKTKVLL